MRKNIASDSILLEAPNLPNPLGPAALRSGSLPLGPLFDLFVNSLCECSLVVGYLDKGFAETDLHRSLARQQSIKSSVAVGR